MEHYTALVFIFFYFYCISMLTGAAGAGGVGAAQPAAVPPPGAHRQTQRQPVR